MASQQPVIVDDQEPRIQYSSGWYIADGSDVALAYNDTLHVTLAQGATASLTFTGTSVAVYGCGGNTNQYGWPSTSFVVDGVSYETRVDKTATPDTQFFNVLMFASPTLPAGEHTIVLTNLNGTAPNTFFFDRFEYIPSNAANKTTSSAPASTASNKAHPFGTSTVSLSSTASLILLSTSASSSSVETISQTPAVTNGGNVGTSRSINTGAIAGAAVGGAVAALLLAGLAVYCLMRRRRARTQGVQPYTFPGNDSTRNSAYTGHRPQLLPVESPPSALAPPAASLLTGPREAVSTSSTGVGPTTSSADYDSMRERESVLALYGLPRGGTPLTSEIASEASYGGTKAGSVNRPARPSLNASHTDEILEGYRIEVSPPPYVR